MKLHRDMGIHLFHDFGAPGRFLQDPAEARTSRAPLLPRRGVRKTILSLLWFSTPGQSTIGFLGWIFTQALLLGAKHESAKKIRQTIAIDELGFHPPGSSTSTRKS